jgi:hypothetical protein
LIETFGAGKFKNGLYHFKVAINSCQFFYKKDSSIELETVDFIPALRSPCLEIIPVPGLVLSSSDEYLLKPEKEMSESFFFNIPEKTEEPKPKGERVSLVRNMCGYRWFSTTRMQQIF